MTGIGWEYANPKLRSRLVRARWRAVADQPPALSEQDWLDDGARDLCVTNSDLGFPEWEFLSRELSEFQWEFPSQNMMID